MGIEERAQVDPWRYEISLGVQCLLGSPGYAVVPKKPLQVSAGEHRHQAAILPCGTSLSVSYPSPELDEAEGFCKDNIASSPPQV